MHGPADSVRLAALDALFPVAVLYEHTDVPEVLPAKSPRPGQGAREIE
jgi:hypothetical protein